MKRIVDNLESLEVVRLKCTKKQSDFNKEELKHLNLVWIELQKSFGKKYVKPLDQSCGYCKITAMNSVHNYIMFEESKEAEQNKAKNIEEVREKNKPNLIGEIKNIYEEVGSISEKDAKKLEGNIVVTFSDNPIEVINVVSDDQLSLKELRTKYPHIKARSVDRFLELLNEQK